MSRLFASGSHKDWRFSNNEYSGLISFSLNWNYYTGEQLDPNSQVGYTQINIVQLSLI